MSYQNEYVLNVDIKKSTTNIVPTFVQYDNAVLIFKIYDNGSAYDLSNFKKAEITHKKPSGEVAFGQGQLINLVSNGQRVIQYRYLGSEMNEIGNVQTSLSVYSLDDEKISTLPFNVKIVKDLREDAAEQVQVEISLLDQIIENADGIINQAMNASQRIDDAMQDIYANLSSLEQIAGEERQRQTDETSRRSNETARQNAESGRVTNEDTRRTNETSRIQSENARIQSENARIASENARIQAEYARIASENTRSEDMGNRIHRGNYSSTTQYFRHNEVSHNGSTYRCIVNSIGIVPTNTSNWTPIAVKGTGIIVSDAPPTSLETGDIWYEILD